jgi:hypothetical protein
MHRSNAVQALGENGTLEIYDRPRLSEAEDVFGVEEID